MFRLLKAEFAYNNSIILTIILLIPLLSYVQLFMASDNFDFLVPIVSFLLVNGMMVIMFYEKRITRLSMLPITTADVGIFRALVILIPYLSVIAVHIMIGFSFGLTAYPLYRSVLTVSGFYFLVSFGFFNLFNQFKCCFVY